LQKHEFEVAMTCEGCSGAVTRILNKLGVKLKSRKKGELCGEKEKRISRTSDRKSRFLMKREIQPVPASDQ
uniref:Copper transport protein ATOX1 n=1 Tax=Oryzias sinensis TaxID=183150 RepID=A0A8C7X6Q6_9TELE